VVVRGERMRKRRIVYLSLVIAILSITLMAATGIRNVSATDTPRIFVFPASRTGPYNTGQLLTWQVRIDSTSGNGAPHVTTEAAADSDKTWAWEVIITYDETVVNVTTAPYRHTSRDWFNSFHKWFWDGDMWEWEDLGSYQNSFAGSVDQDTGTMSAWCGLIEDPTDDLLPSGDEDPFPNAGLHSGSYYDLPYTDGISTSSLVFPPGGWSGDYFILFMFKTTLLVDVPPGYSPLAIDEARLWCYDGQTLYPATTEDADLGTPPSPEFPLGLEIMMMVTAAVPIVYIWRLRKRVHKKVL